MADTISKYAEIIDSRDIIARIEELKKAATGDDWTLEDNDELLALEKVAAQGKNYGNWEYGETLIADSYFETYAEDLANDIGAIDRDAKWPLSHIDWAAAAEDLKQDYTSIDFDGITFWMRS